MKNNLFPFWRPILSAIILLTAFSMQAQTPMADSIATVRLDSVARHYRLEEVTVTARPKLIRLERGRLQVDLPALVANHGVTTIYEALAYMPGMYRSDDVVKLSGANAFSFLLNGKTNGMPQEQIVALLKTMPLERLARTELMYAAPPETGVKGAAVNIILKEMSPKTEPFIQGMASLGLGYERWLNANAGLNLYIHRKQWQWECNLEAKPWNRHRMGEDQEMRHTLFTGHRRHFEQQDRSIGSTPQVTLYTASSYRPNDADSWRLRYYGDVHRSHTSHQSSFQTDGSLALPSETDFNSRHRLHYVGLDWERKNVLEAALYYTAARHNKQSEMTVTESVFGFTDSRNEAILSVNTLGGKISRSPIPLGQVHLRYGVSGQWSRLVTRSELITGSASTPFEQTTTELTGGVWSGVTWQPAPEWSVDASLAMEYYRLTHSDQSKHVPHWDLLPGLTAQWHANADNIVVLSVQSGRNYPNYDYMNASMDYLGPYAVILGNPQLKPARYYNVAMQYIFNRRHTLTAFMNHTRNDMRQMPYQRGDIWQTQFQYVNFDYTRYSGLQLNTPIRPTALPTLGITPNLMVSWEEQRFSHFHEIDLTTRGLFAFASVAVDYALPVLPTLQWHLDASAHSRARQGLFVIHPSGIISAGVTYSWAGGRAKLNLRVDDILGTSGKYMEVREGRQWSNMRVLPYKPHFALRFTYSLGGSQRHSTNDLDLHRYDAVR